MSEFRTIFSHDDPGKVEAVWLALQAMEYPARLADAAGPIVDHGHEEGADRERLPTHVEVPAEHFDDLVDVIDEIVGEQDELDEALALRELRHRRRQRQFRVAVAALVVGLMAFLLGSQLLR